MACDLPMYWYKEIGGKRICSLYEKDQSLCNILIGAVDLSSLAWLVDEPSCSDILLQISIGENMLGKKENDAKSELLDAWLNLRVFCRRHDIHAIMSLLTSLGIAPERIEIRQSLLSKEDYESIEELKSKVPQIITWIDAAILGIHTSDLEEFPSDLVGLNKVVMDALNSNKDIAIIEFFLGPLEWQDDPLSIRRYWAIIEKPKPRFEFVAEEKTEESRKQETKEHEEEEEEQGEEHG